MASFYSTRNGFTVPGMVYGTSWGSGIPMIVTYDVANALSLLYCIDGWKKM